MRGNKKWLISRLKTSGSYRKYLENGDYRSQRHLQNFENFEDLPTREAIKSTKKNFRGGKVNYGLLVRFLRGKVGSDWNAVYSEIISRIPSNLLSYKKMTFKFVATKVEYIDGKPWNKESQQFIWTNGKFEPVHYTRLKTGPQRIEFYVDPNTNKLVRIPQKAFKRLIIKKA